jgi:hypothetical protein
VPFETVDVRHSARFNEIVGQKIAIIAINSIQRFISVCRSICLPLLVLSYNSEMLYCNVLSERLQF